MALIERLEFGESSEEIFMVSDSVGANAANWWTDIQLMQYLIGSIYIYANDGGTDWAFTMSQDEINNLPDPNKDFKKLNRTAELIQRFQVEVNLQGKFTVFADGRADRARGLKSSVSNTYYTIHVANHYFASVITTTQGAENWQGWALNDPDMPAMLKGQLLTNLEV
jgi:hypothetical protein